MPAPSQLQSAITSFRAQLLAYDARVLATTSTVYAPIKAQIQTQINDLVTLAGQNGDLSPAEFFRLDRAQALLGQIDAELASLTGPLSDVVTTAQGVVVNQAGAYQKGLAILSAQGTPLAGTIGGTWTTLPTSALTDLIGRLSDGSPMRAWVDQFGASTSQTLRDALTSGLALGTHPSVIAADLAQQTDVAESRLQAMARTTMLDSFRSSSLRQYAENQDILSGWQWICANDLRSCAACLALDHSLHALSETFMGCHVNCRCTSVAVVKGVKSSMKQSGADFFDSLTPSQQDQTLGKSGGAAYRDGAVTLQDFVAVQPSNQWGDRYVQGSLKGALANAGGG